MHKSALLLACAVGALGFGAGGAYAATATSTAADTSQDTTTVTDIVVTAQKRTENLEKVPVAVSAYTSHERDLVGIDTIQDMTKFTPGLEYSTSLDRAFIRGVGRQTNNLASQPGVATYNDGVYNSSVVSASGDSLFVDRVEILRGPQGTLYGRNAVGGTINSISRRPTDDFYAEARTDFGNYDVYNLEAAVSGPIADGLRFRLAGYSDNQGQGYFTNLAGGPSEGGRGWVDYLEGQVDGKLGDHVDFWVKADTAAWNETYRSGIGTGPYDEAEFPTGSLGPGAAFGFTVPGFTEVGNVTQNPTSLANPRVFSSNTENDSHLTNDYNVSTQLTWHTPWSADLKYIGGFTRYLYNLTEDFDGTSITSYQLPTVAGGICVVACPPLTVFPTVLFNYREDKMYYSNELNLTSTGSGPFQWILGAYEYHEQYFQFVRIPLPDQPQLATPEMFTPSFSLVPSPANPSRDIYDINQHTHADSYAGFAQGDWQVVPTLKLTGGVRYSYDSEEALEATRQLDLGLPAFGVSATNFGAFTPAIDVTSFLISFTKNAQTKGVLALPSYNATTGFYSRPLGANWSAVTGTAGVEWTPDEESLLYAKYSRGYKAGGFNTGSIVEFPETQPEYIDAYEIGGKRDFGRQLQTNVALFYYNYDGMQIPLSVQTLGGGPAQTEFFNMKQVVSYGAELEAVWRPVDDLQFILSYSYLNATIHDKTDCFTDSADLFAVEPGANKANCPVAGPGVPQTQSVNGETVPESPPNKIALNGNYTFHFEPGNLTFSGTFAWQDATYDSIFNRFYTLAPAYDTVDLRLLWTDVKNRYTVILYGKNIFNTLGFDNAGATLESNFVTLNRTYGLTPPRTFGVELQYRFL